MEAFNSKALEQTNMYRKRHRVPDLVLSRLDGASVAMPFAKQLSDSFEFKNNPKLNNFNMGENVFQKMSYDPFSFSLSECRGIVFNKVFTLLIYSSSIWLKYFCFV